MKHQKAQSIFGPNVCKCSTLFESSFAFASFNPLVQIFKGPVRKKVRYLASGVHINRLKEVIAFF